ncbi:uncharacterized protein LAESUDRAFT_746717 [Laetiporus sulphureus 93-53]|uniref:FAD/NAD(P)-binding domain-containing protein n=1 Tax=Laetiporus sulphureus 93-53 TaxID=1314785 RepID=A0A165HMI0_9APHY|nr:uncharacterized protein LAESUDRAFT_746717 [Laetiporus sulphureus 93-53]KZT11929.1 hypothetical protein LAESUDRAFT_746717 [Laetiporus sulphureus 93-53]
MALPTANLIVVTFGPRPNTAWIASLGADVLDERGLMRVEPTFEVVDHPGVFAIGDITDCNEQKQAQKYPVHVAVAAPNIVSYLEGRPLTKPYKGSMEIILIPIGKNRGVAYYDESFTAFVASNDSLRGLLCDMRTRTSRIYGKDQ